METVWFGTKTMSNIEAEAGTGDSDGSWMGTRWRSLEGFRLMLGLTGMVTAVGFVFAC